VILKSLRYTSPLIKQFEKSKIEYYASRCEKNVPVFIIGAPRTGSTILYQILTNTFDVLYINNLVCKLYRNLHFGFWLSNIIFHKKPHNCFISEYGDSVNCGYNAPCECGEFWYRWLPKNKHFIAKGEIQKESIKEIRNNIFSVINKYDKPLIFKNMNAGQRLGLISEIAPNAKIIFIKRNPLYTAQSILQTRRGIFNDISKWWSLMPQNYDELVDLNPYEQVAKQIYYLEKQIYMDSTLFSKENFFTLTYEQLCNDYIDVMNKIHYFLGNGIQKRKNAKTPQIKFSNSQKLEDTVFSKLKTEINKLDWYDYKS